MDISGRAQHGKDVVEGRDGGAVTADKGHLALPVSIPTKRGAYHFVKLCDEFACVIRGELPAQGIFRRFLPDQAGHHRIHVRDAPVQVRHAKPLCRGLGEPPKDRQLLLGLFALGRLHQRKHQADDSAALVLDRSQRPVPKSNTALRLVRKYEWLVVVFHTHAGVANPGEDRRVFLVGIQREVVLPNHRFGRIPARLGIGFIDANEIEITIEVDKVAVLRGVHHRLKQLLLAFQRLS